MLGSFLRERYTRMQEERKKKGMSAFKISSFFTALELLRFISLSLSPFFA